MKSHPEFQGSLAVIIGAVGPYHLARLKSLAELLRSKGCHLVLLLRNASVAEYPWFADPGNVPFRIVRAFTDSNPTPGVLTSGRQIYASLKKLKPDILAFGMPSPAYLGGLFWAQLKRCPAVLLSESKADDASRSLLKEWMKRQVYSCFRAAVVGGPPHVDYAVTLGIPRARCFVGYDVVDNEYFSENVGKLKTDRLKADVKRKYGLPEHYFLASARFIEKKNLPRLLRAYSLYRESVARIKQPGARTPWALVLLGDGPLRPTLNALHSTLGLESCVYMPGLVGYQDLPTYYSHAGAFVHVSTTEQWGLVVNEAMASSLPVLISRTCGCASTLLVEGQNGFAFDPFSTEEIAEAMLRMYQLDLGEREIMGRKSLEIISDWGPQSFAEAMWSALNVGLGGL